MNVTCPQCKTVYRLPDDKAKAGVKLRCSACRHVFVLPEEAPADRPLTLDEEEKQETPSPLAMSGLEGSEPRASLDEGLSFGETSASREDSLDMTMDASGIAGGDEQSDEQYDEDAPVQAEALDMPEEKKSRFEGMFGLLLCIAIIAGGVWAWQNTNYLDGLKTLFSSEELTAEKVSTEPDDIISELKIVEHRGYPLKNKKIGDLLVIEGKVRNNFTTARELISLEAELYGADGKVLASRRQVAGVSLSPFQLEVLDKTELENTLNRKLDIITSNINVLPGAEVPFTVVFSDVPAGASDYKVRIIEASMPKPVGNLAE